MITFVSGPDQLGGQNFKFSKSLIEERQKSRSEVGSFRMLFSKKSWSSSQMRSPIEGEASEVAQKTEKKRSYLSRTPVDVV